MIGMAVSYKDITQPVKVDILDQTISPFIGVRPGIEQYELIIEERGIKMRIFPEHKGDADRMFLQLVICSAVGDLFAPVKILALQALPAGPVVSTI
jgi:hypothetical protein